MRGVIIGTLAYIPVGIVAWLASITVFRNRRVAPVPITLIALVGGVAWTTRSLALIAYLDVSDIPSDASPALRLGAGFIQGALAFVLTAWLFARLTAFHEQRRQLLDALVQEELANDRLHDRVQELRGRVEGQVRRTVDATAQQLNTRSGGDSPSQGEVEVLAETTRQISKKLARDLWEEAAHTARINPLMVVRSAVVNRPFTYWALVPGALLGVIALPIYWSPAVSTLAIAVLTLVAFIITFMANTACPRFAPAKALAAYLASIVLLLSTTFIMEAFIRLLDLTPTGGAGLLWAVAVNYGVFVPLIGIGAHFGRVQQDALTQLRRSISRAEIERSALDREESQLRRELAVSLHGGLQANLTASAMRAQQSIDEGDIATARQVLDDARDLITQGWALQERGELELRPTISAVVESWEGFVDITVHLDVRHEPRTPTVALIKEILLEGIGNAVRHGQATSIAVGIDDHAGNLTITITDDGTGLVDSRTGLGSALFDDIAPNGWSLNPGATGGATLRVALATETRI